MCVTGGWKHSQLLFPCISGNLSDANKTGTKSCWPQQKSPSGWPPHLIPSSFLKRVFQSDNNLSILHSNTKNITKTAKPSFRYFFLIVANESLQFSYYYLAFHEHYWRKMFLWYLNCLVSKINSEICNHYQRKSKNF